MSLIQQNMGAIYDGSQRLIAPVLNSTTATQNWAVGQEFILDGNLYKVTTAISSGSQIIVSGSSANCELADTVTEQIVVTDWIDCKANGISGSVKYKKAGSVVMLSIHVSGLTQSDYTIVGTLPQEVRPSGDTYFCSRTSYSSVNNATIYINSAGTIQVFPVSATQAYGDFTFII